MTIVQQLQSSSNTADGSDDHNTARSESTAPSLSSSLSSSTTKKKPSARRVDRPNCRGISIGTGRPCTRPMPARIPGIERTKEQYYCHQHRSQAQNGHFGLRLQSNGQYVADENDSDTSEDATPNIHNNNDTDDEHADYLTPSEITDIHTIMDQLENMQLNTNNSNNNSNNNPVEDDAVQSLLSGMNQLSVIDNTTVPSNRPLSMPEPNPFISPAIAAKEPSPLGFNPLFLKHRLNQSVQQSIQQPLPAVDNKPLPPIPNELPDTSTSIPSTIKVPITTTTATTTTETKVEPEITTSTEISHPLTTPSKPSGSGHIESIQLPVNQIPSTPNQLSKPLIPSSPFTPAHEKQCQGFIKASGLRCKRVVKNPTKSFDYNYNSVNMDHLSAWLPSSVPDAIKARLLVEMAKPISKDDKPGYIYVYQLRKGPQALLDPDYEFYKIGRTSNLARRLTEWSKQCGYRPRIIECFPNEHTKLPLNTKLRSTTLLDRLVKAASTQNTDTNTNNKEVHHTSGSEWEEEEEDDDDDDDEDINCNNKKNKKTTSISIQLDNDDDYEEHPKSPFAHRLERLIHLELMEQYKFSGISCQGCQTVHQEWFKVPRQPIESTINTNSNSSSRTAWPSIREVVIRWTQFVDTLSSSSSV
ncbi:hypothetical protein BDF19DRAFT_464051 [Syncephalis fuscata]|nr:hypothetical protein BDF19DRAFT_464051 [Syncephalis fuscata]